MSTARRLETNFSEQVREKRELSGAILYGPHLSRMFKRFVGVNVLGAVKACTFDCHYCDLGRTQLRLNQLKEHGVLPSVDQIRDGVIESFKAIHQNGPGIDTICLSGNGEPTIHPEFPEVVRVIMAARDLWLPGKPIALLTNGSMLDSRKIVEAANKLDMRVVKLDAGGDKTFKAFNSPLSRTNLAKVITGIRSMKDVTIQSMFCQGAADNTKPQDIEEWLEVIAMLKPMSVQIQGVSRAPANENIIRCDEDTLHTIASLLERRTGIKALVTP